MKDKRDDYLLNEGGKRLTLSYLSQLILSLLKMYQIMNNEQTKNITIVKMGELSELCPFS